LRFKKDPSVADISSALLKEARLKPEASTTIGFL